MMLPTKDHCSRTLGDRSSMEKEVVAAFDDRVLADAPFESAMIFVTTGAPMLTGRSLMIWPAAQARISDLAPLAARVYTLTRRSATISPPERGGG